MGEQYFEEKPTVASEPREVFLSLPDGEWRFITDRGVFSYREIDEATRLLLITVPEPPTPGPILDLGCGYGVIATVASTRWPERTVWAVDVNERALDLARRNAAALGERIMVATPTQVPATERFAAIYTNPPIRIGKAALHELLLHWLGRLLPAGAAYLVINKNLGADSLAKWLQNAGYKVTRLDSHRGNRVLSVTNPLNS